MSKLHVDGYMIWVPSDNKWHWMRYVDGKYVQFLEFHNCAFISFHTKLDKNKVNWVRADFSLTNQTDERPA